MKINFTVERPINILVVGGESKVARLLFEHCSQLADLNLFFQSRNQLSKADIYWDPLKPNCDIVHKFQNNITFDVLLNLAGSTQQSTAQLNTEIAVNSCILAERLNIPKVFLASSAAVYGKNQKIFSENDCCSPINGYGAAKLEMENICLSRSFNSNILCLRMANFVGADALSVNILSQKPIVLDVNSIKLSGLRSYLAPLSFLKILRTLSTNNTLQNCPINIANPMPFRMQEVLDMLRADYNCRHCLSGISDIELDINLLKSIHVFEENEYELQAMLNQVVWF